MKGFKQNNYGKVKDLKGVEGMKHVFSCGTE